MTRTRLLRTAIRALLACAALVSFSAPAAAADGHGLLAGLHGAIRGLVPHHAAGPRGALIDVPQPGPPGNPTFCPPGANSQPYPLCYFGGPVLHSNSTYTLFWQPSSLPGGVSGFSNGYGDVVNGYFKSLAAAPGANDVYAPVTQYYDGSGSAGNQSSFGGSIVDTNPYPANAGLLGGCPPNLGNLADYCVTDGQLTAELDRVIAAHSWPRGLGATYFVYLPAGVDVCVSGGIGTECSYDTFCAYHSSFGASGGNVLYAIEPYSAVSGCDTSQHPNGSDADPVLDTTSHEHNEMITDPLGDGWLDMQGNENGDKCARNYGPPLGSTSYGQFNQQIANGRYYVQTEWSNAILGCAQKLSDVPPQADFTVGGDTIAAGHPISFQAVARDADGTVTTLKWAFGDGATAAGPAVSHTFTSPGTYTVTLTATDNAGLATIVSHPLVVPASVPTQPGGALTAYGLSPHQSVATALRRGLRLTVRCGGPCSVAITVRGGGHRIGSAQGALTSAGATHLVAKLNAAGRRLLRGRKKASLKLAVVLEGGGGGTIATAGKTVHLR